MDGKAVIVLVVDPKDSVLSEWWVKGGGGDFAYGHTLFCGKFLCILKFKCIFIAIIILFYL